MDSILHATGWTLFVLGWLFGLVGWLWIVVLGWQRNVFWGVICFLVPLVEIVYVATHWKESKKAFFFQIAASALLFLASVMGVHPE
jgi:hypothetical protein